MNIFIYKSILKQQEKEKEKREENGKTKQMNDNIYKSLEKGRELYSSAVCIVESVSGSLYDFAVGSIEIYIYIHTCVKCTDTWGLLFLSCQ